MLRLVIMMILASGMSCLPLRASGVPASSEMDYISVQEPSIKVDGNRISVSGSEGYTLEIYNITGVKVATYRIDSSCQTITHALPKGYYILKVGRLVRKIAVGF